MNAYRLDYPQNFDNYTATPFYLVSCKEVINMEQVIEYSVSGEDRKPMLTSSSTQLRFVMMVPTRASK